MNLIRYKSFSYIFLFFLISVPFLNFIIANISALYFGYYIELFKLFFVCCLSISLITIGLYFFFKKKINIYILSFKLSLLFFLFFHYKYFVFFFQKLNLNFFNPSYFSLIMIIIASIYVIFNNNNKFLDFIKIFLTIIFLFTTVQLISSFFQLENKIDIKKNKIELNNSKKESLDNIYYIIVDAATSLPQFLKFYNLSSTFFDDFKENLKEYKIINESYSTGVKTSVSLYSVIQLKFNEEYYNYKDYQLYPNILRKKTSSNLTLMQLLEKKGYQFHWITNNFINCSLIDFDKCLIKKKDLFNFYITTQFLQQSPIYDIIHKVNPNYYGKNWYKKNDAINNFLSNYDQGIIKKNKNFFFIHHMMPHEPFIFNRDCSYEYFKTSLKDIEKYKEGYFNSYICMTKRILEFNKFIKTIDPNAHVLIQGDHGIAEDFSSTNYDSKTINKNLTIYRTKKNCIMNDNKIYNSNVKMLKFILNCNFNE